MANPVTLAINAAPQTLGNGNAAVVPQANNASLITIAPMGNDIQATCFSAGTALPGSPFSVPGTSQMPYPILNQWNGNNINVTNISTISGSNVAVGYFGVANTPNPTLPLTSSYQTVSQFSSIGGNSTSGPSTIQLLSVSNNVTAVLLFGYGTTPKLYVLNLTGSLPPIFNTLPAGVLVTTANNIQTITDNFWGNYLFMVNISMASTSGVQARLIAN